MITKAQFAEKLYAYGGPCGPERTGDGMNLPTPFDDEQMGIRAVSYGGGVQSTALLVLAAERKIDYGLFLFSNVGDDSEHPATLVYVREVAMPYAEQHGIELVELRKRPKGSERTLLQKLMDPDVRSIGIPVRLAGGAPARRQCTADYKIRRVAAELKRRGASEEQQATVALGISLDEYQRMRTESGIAWERLAYPLIDLRIDRAACVALIERAGLPVPPKSSCFFCPFHTLSVWRKQKRDEPELFAKSVALERTINAKRARIGKDDVWLSSALKPLDEAVGDHDQLDLFEGPSCDIGGYCMA